MLNLPLCHWSSQLFDLRAPSSTDVSVLLLNQPNISESDDDDDDDDDDDRDNNNDNENDNCDQEPSCCDSLK